MLCAPDRPGDDGVGREGMWREMDLRADGRSLAVRRDGSEAAQVICRAIGENSARARSAAAFENRAKRPVEGVRGSATAAAQQI